VITPTILGAKQPPAAVEPTPAIKIMSDHSFTQREGAYRPSIKASQSAKMINEHLAFCKDNVAKVLSLC